jgi:hypothetical protein
MGGYCMDEAQDTRCFYFLDMTYGSGVTAGEYGMGKSAQYPFLDFLISFTKIMQAKMTRT